MSHDRGRPQGLKRVFPKSQTAKIVSIFQLKYTIVKLRRTSYKMGRHLNKRNLVKGDRNARKRSHNEPALPHDHQNRVNRAIAYQDPSDPDKPLITTFFNQLRADKLFTNHAITPFQKGDHRYRSVEHYYMRQKALTFGLGGLADLILKPPGKNSYPREKDWHNPKFLKHQMSTNEHLNFLMRNDVRAARQWADTKLRVMRDAVMAKYRQNKEALKLLLDTGDSYLAEASHDKFWGVGMVEPNPRLKVLPSGSNPWPGENWLGRILMDVRQDLRFRENVQDASQPVANRSQALRDRRARHKANRQLKRLGKVPAATRPPLFDGAVRLRIVP
jgi:ribA/ribD-fused uncharacterized protein